MVFSEAVTMTDLVDNGFTLSGTTSTVFSSISGSGTTWTGVLGTAAVSTETITLSYSSVTGDVVDGSSNALATFSGTAVTNNVSAGSIITFSDDFTGTTLDETTNWNKTVSDPAYISFTQNNELIGNLLGVGTTSFGNNNVTSKTTQLTIPSGAEVRTLTFDVTGVYANTWEIGFYKSLPHTDILNRIIMSRNGTAGLVNIRLFEGGTTIYNLAPSLDVSTLKSVKITVSSTTINWYYWNGSAWASLGSTAHSSSGSYYVGVLAYGTGTAGVTVKIDNLAVTSEDFITLRPT